MLSTTLASSRPPVAFPVLQLPKLELCFKDGSRVWLHQVAAAQPLMRSIDHAGENLHIDLGHLVPDLAQEFDRTAPTDRPALIFFTLRQHFPTSEAFLLAVATPAKAQ
jgi:hypothetical protein